MQGVSNKHCLLTFFIDNKSTKNHLFFQNIFTTVTLWGTCGRYSGRNYHEWDGVVCLGQSDNVNKDGKVRNLQTILFTKGRGNSNIINHSIYKTNVINLKQLILISQIILLTI